MTIDETHMKYIHMLFLPFFADQIKNALYAMKMGIAEAVYKKVGNHKSCMFTKRLAIIKVGNYKSCLSRSLF